MLHYGMAHLYHPFWDAWRTGSPAYGDNPMYMYAVKEGTVAYEHFIKHNPELAPEKASVSYEF